MAKTKAAATKKSEPKKAKKEKLEDIIDAVASKEDVLVPIKGKKAEPKKHVTDFLYSDEKMKTPEGIGRALRDLHRSLFSSKILNMAETFSSPWRYWGLKFIGGFFFTLGVAVTVALVLLLALLLNKIYFISTIFDKFVFMLKAMI